MPLRHSQARKQKLHELFTAFADDFEFKFKEGDNIYVIGIARDGKLIECKFTFDPSDDGYEFMAVLARINDANEMKFARDIMRSPPIRGVTERIIGDKFVILGNQEILDGISDSEVKRVFMSDIYKVSEYSHQLTKLLDSK